jgi:spore maturation protein CgeB
VPLVAMCLDDKQSWAGQPVGSQRPGMIDIARWFDIAWTSSSVATAWYLMESGNPVYLPEGFDASVYRPMAVDRDLDVSFIGDAYGFRPSFVAHLRQHGIPVSTFGGGWNTRRVWGEEQVTILNRSRINLGHGGIGYSEDLTNVKTRDFEVPGTGGGLYVTTFSPDLARHFVIGSEIVCYRSREDAVELINYFLARPEEAEQIAAAGRRRCLAEHRWVHRYRRILELLAILKSGRLP